MAAESLICIIDDDQSLRTALLRLIRSLGYEGRCFASAEEFLDSGIIAESSCVITDIQMPGMNGIALIKVIAEHRPAVPVIAITARAEAGLEENALASGALRFLRKPLDTDALIEGLERALKA